MTRSWNQKALIDILADELWDASTAFRAKIIRWLNEIQDDIAGELPLELVEFQLKKLLPTQQELIDLSPQIPSAPTTALASGGSLTENSTYKVYTTFVIYDPDTKQYMESEPSLAGTARQATSSDKTINLTAIDTHDGDTTVSPTTIYRNIYVSILASGGTEYGEPFYHGQIADNSTTTYSITSEPTSTVTPPSDSELDQLSSKAMIFSSGNRYLLSKNINEIKRADPNNAESATPNYFDYIGDRRISLYPKLTSTATTAQRTLQYFVYRRPHEFFYDVDRKIDLPIGIKKALIAGVIWKAYEFRDRAGKESKLSNYEELKKMALKKYKRQKGRPRVVRDVQGDTFGFEV